MRKFCGRKKITIPVSKEKFDANPSKYIEHYLGKCVSINNQNANDYEVLNDYYCGKQKILLKQRLNGDTENNNIIVVNHVFRQVEFKKGVMVGNPITYSLAVSDKSTEDLTLLQRYFSDSCKSSKDIDKYEDLYIGGIALQFIIPRTDEFDKKNEAPFEIYNIGIGNAFKVYSSDAAKTPLFDVVISETIDTDFKTKKLYTVYFVTPKENDGYCVSVKYDDRYKKIEKEGKIQAKKEPMKFLPLVEYALNKNRMGIVELVMAIQDGLNIIQSNQIDDIVDFVNSYFVFENQDLGKDWEKKVKKFRANRAILLRTKNPALPAKLNLLKQTMQNTEINAFFELMLQEMYDIVACPKTSGGVTSGGDTGQARLIGNGWESAQNQAQVDISYSLQYEKECLRKILYVCKEINVLSNLFVADIDIKYSINMSNNILTKTQALQNLYDMNVPYEDALNITNVTSDTHGLAEKWAKNDAEQKERESKSNQEKSKTDSNATNLDSDKIE